MIFYYLYTYLGGFKFMHDHRLSRSKVLPLSFMPPERLDMRRNIKLLVVFAFLFAQNAPVFMAFAAPQLFARPGAGVSRLPLEVVSFETPGFGDLRDAINLATGNVYVSLDGLARNNLLTAGDENASIAGGQWNLTNRLRLGGFVRNSAIAAAPTSTTLFMGDGSGTVFNRVNSPSWTTVPSWIARYQAVNGTSVVLYAVETKPGIQYSQEWIAFVYAGAQLTAHYYDHNGLRHTFAQDGEYEDFSQNLYQQFRSAKYQNDVNGTGASSPKTEITYANAALGMIGKVKDEWGRVTTYEWDSGTQTLNAINFLPRNEAAPSSTWIRRTELTYGQIAAQRVITGFKYRTNDGLTSKSRSFEISYVSQNGKVLVSATKKPIIQQVDQGFGGSSHVTTYAYDGSSRITAVTETGEPNLAYSYTTSAITTGPQVTIEQAQATPLAKRLEFHFDGSGQLLRKRVWSNNPDLSANTPNTSVTCAGATQNACMLEWVYTYYGTGSPVRGSTESVTTPSLKKTQFFYDTKGNLINNKVFDASTGSPVQIREQVFAYDNDNYPTLEHTPLANNYVVYPVSYNYQALSKIIARNFHNITVSGQVFKAPSAINHETRIGGSLSGDVLTGGTLQFTVANTIDESGRTSQVQRVGAGQTQTTAYTYHTGADWIPMLPDSAGNPQNGVATKQYGNLVSDSNINGAVQQYNYDALGHVVSQIDVQGFVKYFQAGVEVTKNRITRRAYNGFGQMIWTHISDSEGDVLAKKMNSYYASGEIDSSWSGQNANSVQYQYGTSVSSIEYGRLTKIIKPHDTTSFTYDVFGRMASELTAFSAYTTSFQYDTLDRLVKEVRPDGGRSHYQYDITGEKSKITTFEVSNSQNIVTSYVHDALGRATQITYPDGNTSQSWYDPYDRPIKVIDNRLTMNQPGEDRAYYSVYDSSGHLTQQTDPVIRSNNATSPYSFGYTDLRRPMTEYTYDALGRRTAVKVLLNSSTNQKAITTTEYNALDQVIRVTDPENYATVYNNDLSGQVSAITTDVWKGSEADYGTLGGGNTTVTLRTLHDGVGRVIARIDAIGNRSGAKYDLTGNMLSMTDSKGVTTKVMTYTPDGLLENVYQPDMNPATPATGNIAAGYTLTSQYVYGYSGFPIYPSQKKTLTMDQLSSVVDYTYNHRGQLLQETRNYYNIFKGNSSSNPGGVNFPSPNSSGTSYGSQSKVSRSYDSRGNLIEQLADDLLTKYTYDQLSRLTSKTEFGKKYLTGSFLPSFSANGEVLAGTDPSVAFGLYNQGIATTYQYDPKGNLTEKSDGNLTTYFFNTSQGKVIAETRPYDFLSMNTVDAYANGPSNAKLWAYRLDGQMTAETTYHYTGNLSSNLEATSSNPPSANSGQVVGYDLDRKGNRITEYAVGRALGASAEVREYTATNSYNGLGLRGKRFFTGVTSIYAEQRRFDGSATGSADYQQFWKYNPNQQLIESWTTLSDGSDRNNSFTYSYSPTGKELTQVRDVRVNIKTPGNQQVLSATITNSSAIYNERDLLSQTSVTDVSPNTTSVTQNTVSSTTATVYDYYQDGNKKLVTVNGNTATSSEYWYDNAGREVKRRDGTRYIYTDHLSFGGKDIWKNEGYTDEKTTLAETDPRTIGNLAINDVDTTSALHGQVVYNRNSRIYKTRNNTFLTYNRYGLMVAEYSQNPTQYTNQTPIRTFAYDANNKLVTEGSTTYTLSSSGLRLAKQDGTQKRYDAEQRAVLFNQPMVILPNFDGATVKFYSLNFAYDPYGREVLASDFATSEMDGNPSYNAFNPNSPSNYIITYTSERNIITQIAIDGNLQVIRSRKGQQTDQYQGSNVVVFDTSDRIRDETFSYIDNTESWAILHPFALPTVTALAAAQAAISGQLGIDLAVQSPGAPLTAGNSITSPALAAPSQALPSGLQQITAPAATAANQGAIKAQGLVTAMAIPANESLRTFDTVVSLSDYSVAADSQMNQTTEQFEPQNVDYEAGYEEFSDYGSDAPEDFSYVEDSMTEDEQSFDYALDDAECICSTGSDEFAEAGADALADEAEAATVTNQDMYWPEEESSYYEQSDNELQNMIAEGAYDPVVDVSEPEAPYSDPGAGDEYASAADPYSYDGPSDNPDTSGASSDPASGDDGYDSGSSDSGSSNGGLGGSGSGGYEPDEIVFDKAAPAKPQDSSAPKLQSKSKSALSDPLASTSNPATAQANAKKKDGETGKGVSNAPVKSNKPSKLVTPKKEPAKLTKAIPADSNVWKTLQADPLMGGGNGKWWNSDNGPCNTPNPCSDDGGAPGGGAPGGGSSGPIGPGMIRDTGFETRYTGYSTSPGAIVTLVTGHGVVIVNYINNGGVSGTGSAILAGALKATNTAPSTITLSNVINQQTLTQLSNGVAPMLTTLGRTVCNAVSMLGGRVTSGTATPQLSTYGNPTGALNLDFTISWPK
jgi:YD repeat-containing protein